MPSSSVREQALRAGAGHPRRLFHLWALKLSFECSEVDLKVGRQKNPSNTYRYVGVATDSPEQLTGYKLRPMTGIRAAFLLALLTVGAACNQDSSAGDAAPVSETPAPSRSSVSRFAATGWPDDAGPVIALPGTQPGTLRLVLPELTDKSLTDTSSFNLDSLPSGRVQLFARAKRVGFAKITEGGTEEIPRGCTTWPAAELVGGEGPPWDFGLAADVADALPVQAWGIKLAGDSAAAATAALRIVSLAKGDSTFRAIPFYLRYMYRLELGTSRVLIADAVRRINTEANVREQHVLLIAERSSESGTYVSAYRHTRVGGEDEVQVPEIIGAVWLGENRRPAILVNLEYSEGSRLLLLERIGAGQWTLRWKSAYSGC